MTGPAWLGAGIAAVMLAIAACCAARLAIWQLRGRRAEPDVDALHVLMGVAMAGMLEPRLRPVPSVGWLMVFGAAAAWFGWRAAPRRRRRPAGRAGWGCAHPAPHVAECAAMCYMLWPAGRGGHGPAMAMPGMGGSIPAANPALALVLAFFMLGYILWTTDQLAATARTRTAVVAAGPPDRAADAAGSGWPVPVPSAGRVISAGADASAAALLAPRFAACYKIAMSVAMGYMLIAML